MCDSEDRPVWGFTGMTEAEFRRIHRIGAIVAIAARWEMTGADTTREWLEAEARDGAKITLPNNWKVALKFVGYASNPGLFALTYEGERMRAQIDAIDKWEEKNRHDRAEFERLKRKFSGGP